MKFSCQSDQLQKAVNLVEKAISNRTSLPVMENIYLQLENNKLLLRGNDLEVGIEYSIAVENVIEDGSVLIRANTFSNIISKMDNDKIEITVDDQKKVVIKSE